MKTEIRISMMELLHAISMHGFIAAKIEKHTEVNLGSMPWLAMTPLMSSDQIHEKWMETLKDAEFTGAESHINHFDQELVLRLTR